MVYYTKKRQPRRDVLFERMPPSHASSCSCACWMARHGLRLTTASIVGLRTSVPLPLPSDNGPGIRIMQLVHQTASAMYSPMRLPAQETITTRRGLLEVMPSSLSLRAVSDSDEITTIHVPTMARIKVFDPASRCHSFQLLVWRARPDSRPSACLAMSLMP